MPCWGSESVGTAFPLCLVATLFSEILFSALSINRGVGYLVGRLGVIVSVNFELRVNCVSPKVRMTRTGGDLGVPYRDTVSSSTWLPLRPSRSI